MIPAQKPCLATQAAQFLAGLNIPEDDLPVLADAGKALSISAPDELTDSCIRALQGELQAVDELNFLDEAVEEVPFPISQIGSPADGKVTIEERSERSPILSLGELGRFTHVGLIGQGLARGPLDLELAAQVLFLCTLWLLNLSLCRRDRNANPEREQEKARRSTERRAINSRHREYS